MSKTVQYIDYPLLQLTIDFFHFFFFSCIEPSSSADSWCWCVQYQEQPGGRVLQEAGADPTCAQR